MTTTVEIWNYVPTTTGVEGAIDADVTVVFEGREPLHGEVTLSRRGDDPERWELYGDGADTAVSGDLLGEINDAIAEIGPDIDLREVLRDIGQAIDHRACRDAAR